MFRSYFVAGILSALVVLRLGTDAAAQTTQIVMHEVTTRSNRSGTLNIDVGGGVGNVGISFFRDVEKSSIERLELKYGGSATVSIPQKLVDCFPDLLVELAGLMFIAPDDAGLSGEWSSTLVIPFGSLESDELGVYKINLYPSVGFEIVGGKRISKIRVWKNETEEKDLANITLDTSCPKDLVRWAVAKSI